jgi:hypothetical protein
MYGMITLSPTRSSFSISTMSTSTSSPPEQGTLGVHLEGMDIDVGNPGPTLATPRMDAVVCLKCVDILSRLLEAAKRFPQPKLQAEALQHFSHHETSVPMDEDFRRLAGLMADLAKRKNLAFMQDYLNNIADLSLVDDHVDIDREPEEDIDMDRFFDFDGYDTNQNADVSGLGPERAIVEDMCAKSESSSELSCVSDVSALDPSNGGKMHGVHCATPEATDQGTGQARIVVACTAPFAYVQSQEKDFDDDDFTRHAICKEKTMQWLEKVE